MSARILGALAVADFRERTGRPAYLVTLAAAIVLGYLALPPASSLYVIMNAGGYRGTYNSAYAAVFNFRRHLRHEAFPPVVAHQPGEVLVPRHPVRHRLHGYSARCRHLATGADQFLANGMYGQSGRAPIRPIIVRQAARTSRICGDRRMAA